MISIILTLVIVGVVLYLLTLIPMDATIATVIRVVVVLFAIIWLVQSIGLIGGHSLRL